MHTDHLRRLNVLLALLYQRRSAHGAREVDPLRCRDGQYEHVHLELFVHRARKNTADHTVDEQRDENGGERQLNVGDAHDDAVDLAADIAAHQAEKSPEQRGENDRGKADAERNLQPEHDGREDVAPLIVGTEHKAGVARGPELVRETVRREARVHQIEGGDVVRVVRCDPRGQRGHGKQQHGHGEGSYGDG